MAIKSLEDTDPRVQRSSKVMLRKECGPQGQLDRGFVLTPTSRKKTISMWVPLPITLAISIYKKSKFRFLKILFIAFLLFLVLCGFIFWFGANDEYGKQSASLRWIEIGLVIIPVIILFLMKKLNKT
jgi:hypothetical protein